MHPLLAHTPSQDPCPPTPSQWTGTGHHVESLQGEVPGRPCYWGLPPVLEPVTPVPEPPAGPAWEWAEILWLPQ